jgi:hypothetical protein
MINTLKSGLTAAVESRKGAKCIPRRMTRFPSPLIKPDMPISSIRLSDRFHQLARGDTPPVSDTKAQNTQLPEHNPARELNAATRLHLMTPSHEVPHTLIYVVVDCAIAEEGIPTAEIA